MKANSGFSLIEVIVAILILGVGLVGLTQGITTALGSSKAAEQQTGAALLAAGQLEALRAEGYLTDGTTEGETVAGQSLFHWRQTVTRTDVEGLHEVLVEVGTGSSEAVIFELRTLLFEPPPESGTDSQTRRGATSRARGGRS